MDYMGSVNPKLAVKLPCASASIRRTLLPCFANPIPKLLVVVVFAVLCEASHKVAYGK